MTHGLTRRALLAAGLPMSLAAALNPPARKSKPLPSVGDFVRFTDPTTESTVVRLTNPGNASLLPALGNRFISVRERFLVFSSDQTGRATPFRLDLRTGALRSLAPTGDLLTRSLCLDAEGRFLYLLDGTSLKQVGMGNGKVETLSDGVSAFSPGSSVADLIVVRQGRLQQLKDKARVLADNVGPWCALQPGGAGCAFAREITPEGQELWYTPVSEVLNRVSNPRPVLLAQGRVSNPLWSPDGKSLLFLRDVPSNGILLSEIHEAYPDTGLEQRVASTSQFATVAPNADGTVFVGASRSKAQPTVILLLRSAQRELTLCEHRATHPASVAPVFSPDSRRVYFQSDHQGKAALYSVNVESLVEPTAAAAV